MITTLSRRASLFFVLSCCLAATSSVLGAAAISVDLGDAIRAIREFADDVIKHISDRNKERIKSSVAALSARMSRIAGLKRSFAGFLDGKPATFAEFTPEDRTRTNGQLQRLTEEIGGLRDDLDALDDDWAAKNPTLNASLSKIASDKELKWPGIGPNSANLDVRAFRQWLIDEAKMLEAAASEIKSKLPA